MSNYIISPYSQAVHRHTTWAANSNEVLPLLGLKAGGHLPVEGMPPRKIQGITVWVEPAPTPDLTMARDYTLRRVKSSKHRVMAECPVCRKHMSLGRLQQHSKIHP